MIAPGTSLPGGGITGPQSPLPSPTHVVQRREIVNPQRQPRARVDGLPGPEMGVFTPGAGTGPAPRHDAS